MILMYCLVDIAIKLHSVTLFKLLNSIAWYLFLGCQLNKASLSLTGLGTPPPPLFLKGTLYQASLRNLTSLNAYLQWCKHTNKGSVLSEINMPVYWSDERSEIILKPPGAINLNLKKSSWIFQVSPLWLGKIAKISFLFHLNSTICLISLLWCSRHISSMPLYYVVVTLNASLLKKQKKFSRQCAFSLLTKKNIRVDSIRSLPASLRCYICSSLVHVCCGFTLKKTRKTRKDKLQTGNLTSPNIERPCFTLPPTFFQNLWIHLVSF